MVNDPVFEKRGIPASVHEGILSFFVFLAFIDRQGRQHLHSIPLEYVKCIIPSSSLPT